ncbi:MAG: lysophospholipid acyltransferase family protein [Oligoflexales bacterium]
MSIVEKVIPILKFLKFYHQHKVVGLERLPEHGAALVLFNHSLATYDMGLFGYASYEKYGRFPRVLADHFFFKADWMAQLVEGIGGVDGNMDNGLELLKKGELVGIAPGGMRESLRPSSQRYQLLWERRKGFAKMAIQAQVPVIITICPRADDLYDVYPFPMTKAIYKRWKFPFFLARGFGLSLLPRPVQLTHYVSEPIQPPKLPKHKKKQEQVFEEFHQFLVESAQKLLAQAVITPYSLEKKL